MSATTLFRTCGLVILLLVSLLGSQTAQAQFSITDSVSTFPTSITGVNTAGGVFATGMAGSCFTLPCCSTLVYKVTLPTDGALRVENNNYVPLTTSIICYYAPFPNPNSFADLTYISSVAGNFCGFRDSLQLGRGYQNWNTTPLGGLPTPDPAYSGVYDFNNPTFNSAYFPAGDYYICFFNENQQTGQGVGTVSTLTFEFAPGCEPLTAPASVTFDALEPNAGMDTVGFHLTNNRTLGVTIDLSTGINFTGSDAGQFTVLTQPDSVIAVGDSSYMEVVFAPTSGGSKSASLEIDFADSTCSATTTIALSGTGTQPSIKLLGNGVSISNNDFTPSTSDDTNVGSLLFNSGTITKTFTITNQGTDTLELTGNPVVDLMTNGSQFVLMSSPAATILPGDSSSFDIAFTPTAAGLDTADISIANNVVGSSPFQFRVIGQGAGLNGLDLDGSGDYVTINAVSSEMVGVTTFTFETWIKVDPGQSGNDMILGVNTSSNGARHFLKLDDGVWEWDAGTTSRTLSGPDLRDDAWHHVAFTFNNGDITYYLDGEIESTNTNNVPPFSATDKWSLGQEFDSGSSPSDFLNGSLNETRLWKDVRTASEISGGRFCEYNGTDSNLVAYYTYNQGLAGGSNTSISTLTDASGNGYDGTIVGVALTGTGSNFIDASNVGTGCTSMTLAVCDAATYTSPSGQVWDSTGLYIDTIPANLGGDSVLYINLMLNMFSDTVDMLTDTMVCDTLLEVAQTSLTPMGSFAKADEHWIEINGVVDSLVNTNRSVFCWMKAAGQVTGSNQVLVGINSSGTATITNFGIRTNEELWIYDGGTNRNSGVVVTDGNWHYVGYTYDEGSNLTTFWIDGVAVSTFSNGQSISGTNRISIGQEFDSTTDPTDFFDGNITQVSLWNELLDSAEIATIMHAPVQATHPKYSNLKAYYPMVRACADGPFAVSDLGPHGYHGTASTKTVLVTDSLVDLAGFDATSMYSKDWTVNGSTISTDDTLFVTSNVQPGSYNLSMSRDFFTINDPWAVTVDPVCAGAVVAIAVNSNATCNGASDGSLTASATSGTSPYTFLWSSGATTATIGGLPATTYTVTMTDGTGATSAAMAAITEPGAVAVSLTPTPASCRLAADAQLMASASNGSSPYSYAWSNASTTATITGLSGVPTFTVTVTDANGCTGTASDQSSWLCPTPTGLKEWNIQDTTVWWKWDTICGATGYKVRYKVAGVAASWTPVLTQGSAGVLQYAQLSPGTTYRWTVQARCSGIWGPISAENKFKTLGGPCLIPSGLSTSPAGMDKARLNWTPIANAKRYRIRWRLQGSGTWNSATKDGGKAKHWIGNLSSASTYEWQIKTVCELGDATGTPWSALQTFTTVASAKTYFLSTGEETAGVIRVFPNPSNGTFGVDLRSLAEPVDMVVTDLAGQVVYTKRSSVGELATIKLHDIASGLYFLSVTHENLQFVEKIVVE